jgi:hypothetical protein
MVNAPLGGCLRPMNLLCGFAHQYEVAVRDKLHLCPLPPPSRLTAS